MEDKLKESIKEHKKEFIKQKKMLDSELLSVLKDESISAEDKAFWSGMVSKLKSAMDKGDSTTIKKLLSELQNKNS